MKLTKEVRAYLAEKGKKGGSAKSAAKSAANKKNAAKRWKNHTKKPK